MNLYLVFRNDEVDHEECESIIVAAESEQDARGTHPYYKEEYTPAEEVRDWLETYSCWVPLSKKDTLTVRLIGKATEDISVRQVVHESFRP